VGCGRRCHLIAWDFSNHDQERRDALARKMRLSIEQIDDEREAEEDDTFTHVHKGSMWPPASPLPPTVWSQLVRRDPVAREIEKTVDKGVEKEDRRLGRFAAGFLDGPSYSRTVPLEISLAWSQVARCPKGKTILKHAPSI
jgi:hypothetical protein